MSDWPDDEEDEMDEDFYDDDDDGFDGMHSEMDVFDDDDFEPEPPILNTTNPCGCCFGRGYYIDDLDPDKGYVRCVDCGGSGSATDAMNKESW